MSGSEDGMVYIWDSDASPVAKSAAVLPPNMAVPPNAVVASPYASSVPARSKTAYHHPYAAPVATAAAASVGMGTNLKPVAVLEGHGDGTVYEAIWSEGAGAMASCGDDGNVCTWGSA
jgi:hypothetical protein